MVGCSPMRLCFVCEPSLRLAALASRRNEREPSTSNHDRVNECSYTHVRVYVTDPYKPVELIDILYNLVTYSVHFLGKKIFIYRQKTYI